MKNNIRTRISEIIYGSVPELTWVQAHAIRDKILALPDLPEMKKLEMWDSLVEALETISEGKGRYSREPLIHASNTVEDMKQIAVEALSKVKALEVKHG